MNEEKVYHGSCFCGAVQLTAKGNPEAMGYCHCDSCRHWSASPVNPSRFCGRVKYRIHARPSLSGPERWNTIAGG